MISIAFTGGLRAHCNLVRTSLLSSHGIIFPSRTVYILRSSSYVYTKGLRLSLNYYASATESDALNSSIGWQDLALASRGGPKVP